MLIPLTPNISPRFLTQWSDIAFANEDLDVYEYIQTMLNYTPDGIAALMANNRVSVIMYFSSEPACLTHMQTNPNHMNNHGTLFIKNMCENFPDLHYSDTLHPRWKIACEFFK